MLRKPVWFAVVVAIALLAGCSGSRLLKAEEPLPPPAVQQPGQAMTDDERQALMQKVQAVMTKRNAGQALTEEEQGLLDKARAMGMGRAGAGAGGGGHAGGPGAAGQPGLAGMSDDDRRAFMQKFMAAMQKRQRGEALTDEEQGVLDKGKTMGVGRMMGGDAGGGGGRVGPGPTAASRSAQPTDPRALLSGVNVVDRALLSAALSLSAAGKTDEGLALVDKVLQKSPDKNATGLARFVLGKAQMAKGDAAVAEKTMRAVTGRAAVLAFTTLAEPLVKNNDAAGLSALYKDLLAAQITDLDRCRLLQALIDLVDNSGTLPTQARVEILSTAAAGVTYEQAMATRDALAQEKAAQSQAAPMMNQTFFNPRGMGPQGDGGMPQGAGGGQQRRAGNDPNF